MQGIVCRGPHTRRLKVHLGWEPPKDSHKVNLGLRIAIVNTEGLNARGCCVTLGGQKSAGRSMTKTNPKKPGSSPLSNIHSTRLAQQYASRIALSKQAYMPAQVHRGRQSPTAPPQVCLHHGEALQRRRSERRNNDGLQLRVQGWHEPGRRPCSWVAQSRICTGASVCRLADKEHAVSADVFACFAPCHATGYKALPVNSRMHSFKLALTASAHSTHATNKVCKCSPNIRIVTTQDGRKSSFRTLTVQKASEQIVR
jgi:hypothetical protein